MVLNRALSPYSKLAPYKCIQPCLAREGSTLDSAKVGMVAKDALVFPVDVAEITHVHNPPSQRLCFSDGHTLQWVSIMSKSGQRFLKRVKPKQAPKAPSRRDLAADWEEASSSSSDDEEETVRCFPCFLNGISICHTPVTAGPAHAF